MGSRSRGSPKRAGAQCVVAPKAGCCCAAAGIATRQRENEKTVKILAPFINFTIAVSMLLIRASGQSGARIMTLDCFNCFRRMRLASHLFETEKPANPLCCRGCLRDFLPTHNARPPGTLHQDSKPRCFLHRFGRYPSGMFDRCLRSRIPSAIHLGLQALPRCTKNES